MAIIDSEERTKLLRKSNDGYEALKLPVSELRIDNSSDTYSITTNPVLISNASNVCTWSISNVKSSELFVQLHEVSTGNTVVAPFSVDTELRNNVSYYTLNIYIKSSNNIPANTYKAVIIG